MNADQGIVSSRAQGNDLRFVALLSDRWLSQPEWASYGMRVERLGPVAFEQFIPDPPDAIVVDVPVVEAHQLDVCWQLHHLLDIPLVIVAAEMASMEVMQYLNQGAAEVLVGPMDANHLAASIAAILRRARMRRVETPSTRVQLGAVTVDLASRTVTRGSRSQTLSRTEYQLLQVLIDAGGRACSQRELVARVWGPDVASAGRYLRLYVRHLRQKLEEHPQQPRYLLNVWGVGYRLVLDIPKQQGSNYALAAGSADVVPPGVVPSA